MEKLKDIRILTLEQIASFLKENGEKAFRAKQIHEWLWKKSCTRFDEMTNLSVSTREMLKSYFTIEPVTIKECQVSNDRTVKYSLALHDTNEVEGVLIPTPKRMTSCISSQVGCSLSCSFCATGYLKRMRNLTAGEIYDQVVLIKNEAKERYNAPLTNIVYMGMGEPLLNYNNVLQSIEYITSEKGLGMSPRRITVSTAGIAKQIKKLADDDVKFNLALSLHAANDTKRNEIMPINESNTLEALTEALIYFCDKTESIITLEYIIFDNFNDTLDDARELYDFAKKIPCKINIIEYNPIEQAEFKNADVDKVDKFSQYLEQKKVTVNVRRSRGKDIDAACGQLAGKKEKT